MPEPAQAPLTLAPDALTRVKGWVTAADQRRKDFEALWDENAKRFQPPPSELTKTRGRYDINTNVDFRQVEQTKPQLFYATPDVQLEPTSPGRPMPVTAIEPAPPVDPNVPPAPQPTVTYDTAIAIHQNVLKAVLGPRPLGVDALRAVQAVLTDVLAISGIGWVEVGRELYTRDVETVDPVTNEPLTVKVPIYERPFLSHFSPAKGLVPSDAVGSDPDNWSWVGRHWCRPVTELRTLYGKKIPDDFKGTARKDPYRLRADDAERTGDVDLATGKTIWLKANLLDGAEHPLKIRELVICDDIDEPLEYRDSPYQTFGEDGQLTADSMVGFPIYPLILQDAPDSPYVLAQSSMTRALVEELNTYRAQSLAHRDAGKPVILVNASKFSQEQIDELKAKGSHFVFLPDEDWPVGQPPILPVTMPGLPRDNYEGGAIVERDIEKTHAIGANQSGAANSGRRSATEIQHVQGNADVRTASLRGRSIDWYLKVVAKLDRGVVVRYAPEQQGQWVQVLGEQDAATWYQWNKQTLGGECLYRAKPDSQLFVDAAQDRAQFLQFYNLAAPSPNFDRLELDKALARKFGMPDKIVRPPQPNGPPPPKVSASVNIGDADKPGVTPLMLAVLEQGGFKFDAQMMENMNAEKAQAQAEMVAGEIADTRQSGQAPPRPKGDVAEKAASLDAHQERRTGGIEGIGTVQ